MEKLIVSSAPHIRQKTKTKNVMLDVIIALLPAAILSVVYFKLAALTVLITCIVSCVAFEGLYQKLMKQPVRISDLSAVVTGTLLAFCLPPGFPIWMSAIGSLVAIIVTKQLFGGLGSNFANPAIVGRIVLMLSFAGPMNLYLNAFDATAGPTPLAIGSSVSYLDLFLGNIGGSLGEVSKVALILGGLYLIIKKVITPTIPLAMLGSMAVIALLFGEDPLFHVLSGGAVLGAFFMATDYVTSPSTERGKLIFGIGIGFISMLIRLFAGGAGTTIEGVSFAILLMNILTPPIDMITRTKPLGGNFNA